MGRLEGMEAGFKMFLIRPLTGVGIGAFGRAHYIIDGIGSAAHSLIGQLVGELGLVGVVAFIWFIVVKVKNLKGTLAVYHDHNWPSDFLSVTTKAMQTALIILLIQGFSGHNLFRYNWYIFACFLSIIVTLVNERRLLEQKLSPAEDNGQTAAGLSGSG